MAVKTVLIVEDDADNRAIYQTVLDHAGYRVLVAFNGQEGVELALRHVPDMILMDLSMPVVDGWGAIQRIRADARTESIPVCVLSAHVLIEGAYAAAMEAGFQCYLTKPVEPKRVLQQVREQIGPP